MTDSAGTTQDTKRNQRWARELEASLETEFIGLPILTYAQTSSTNDMIKTLANEGAPEGLTVIAREQTQGRGQLGRTWFSPAGLGVSHLVSTPSRARRAHRPLPHLPVPTVFAAST